MTAAGDAEVDLFDSTRPFFVFYSIACPREKCAYIGVFYPLPPGEGRLYRQESGREGAVSLAFRRISAKDARESGRDCGKRQKLPRTEGGC